MTYSKAIHIIFTFIMLYSASNILDENKLYAADFFPSQGKKQSFTLSDGIANLKWGISIEEAQKIYPDFKRERDEPDNNSDSDDYVEYIRESDDLKIAGYSMDSVEYTFVCGKLTSVGMKIYCHEYKACNVDIMYQDIVKSMREHYGKPYNISSRIYENDDMIKKRGGVQKNYEIEWKHDDESIHITESVDPKLSSILITIFSYQGYFIAKGPADAVSERQKIKHSTRLQKKSKKEITYNLSEGFRSLKWGMNISDAKKIYPDLLFFEQIPLKDPEYLYYRRNYENKSISGIVWDRIKYVFSKDRQFCAADAESRYELEEKNKAIELFNEMFDKISTKYGKPSHHERTDKGGYPYVYSANWDKETERISLRLEANIFNNHVIIKNTNSESTLSMLELNLHLYSKKGEGKVLDF